MLHVSSDRCAVLLLFVCVYVCVFQRHTAELQLIQATGDKNFFLSVMGFRQLHQCCLDLTILFNPLNTFSEVTRLTEI